MMGAMASPATPIRITGEPSTDPAVCRFVVDRPVFAGGSFHCADAESARGSALLEALFAIPGVAQVHVEGTGVTVAKESSAPWPELGRQIGQVIRAHFA